MSSPEALRPQFLEMLSARNFERLAKLIYGYSGIKMPASKLTMLTGRLRRRVAALGLADIDDYCAFLFERGGLDAEFVELINAVTTNKTDFFRERNHFDFLQARALPDMAAEGRREIKVWSAAASTGAEAYSIAMVMAEFCRTREGLDYSILATDICTEVLQQALSGRYTRSTVASVAPALRRRYVLESIDPTRGDVRIAAELRSKVAVARLNLMDRTYAVARNLDFIFCRNVLIYFDKPTQSAVLQRLIGHLRPGGYLMLGHSERLPPIAMPVRPVAGTIYQRV